MSSVTRVVVYCGDDVVIDEYLRHPINLEPGDVIELTLLEGLMKARHVRKIKHLKEQMARQRDRMKVLYDENRSLKKATP